MVKTFPATLRRYAHPRAWLVLWAGALLTACGALSPGTSSQPPLEPSDAAPARPATSTAGQIPDSPTPGGSPSAASGATPSALNLRLLEKVSPTEGDGDLPVGP